MARRCDLTGACRATGSVINRSGKAKKKGGIGMHVTKVTPRTFQPNIQRKRIWVPELKKFVTLKLTARAMKTIDRKGAFAALKKAGLV